MSRFARRHQKDKNEDEIIKVFKKAGAEVFIIDRPFDLLVAYHGELVLVEVKTQKGKLSDTQKQDLSKLWQKGITIHVVRNKTDVKNVLQELRQGRVTNGKRMFLESEQTTV